MKAMRFIVLLMAVFTVTFANAKKHKSSVSPVTATSSVSSHKINEDYKIRFIKDDQGRVQNKIIYKSNSGEWVPLCAYSVPTI